VKDIVLQQSLVNHYAVDADLASLLNKRFPKGEWWHVQSLLLTKTAAGGVRVTATIRFNEVQLTVEKNGNWLLLQSYNYHTPEDVLYYILNAMQQLDLTQEETTVYLQGMIDQHSALYDVLHLYILNLQLKDELQFSFPAATEEHPVHLSSSLDQVLVCVS
jgi:predicted metal-dependent RNase